LPGSQISITCETKVEYAVGEAGWISRENAGPVISGNGKTVTVYYDVEDLVLGDDNFTLHIFNGAKLLEVTLGAAPEGFEVEPNPIATEGATKIVLPQGHKITGKGDLSKVDYKKIRNATGKTLVFYFDDKADTESGILKFGPKYSDIDGNYEHYGIGADGKPVIGNDGWRNAALTDKKEIRKIEYTVAEINAAFPLAEADYKKKPFDKLEINNDASGKEGELLYIELK